MKWTLYRGLVVFAYIVVVLLMAIGFGKLGLNLVTFSTYRVKAEDDEQDFHCFNELGHYDLFWNLSVAIPIVYICLGGLLLVAVFLKAPGLMSMWLIFFMVLIFLNLTIQVAFLTYHCSHRGGGNLIGAVVLEAALQTVLAIWVAALWWRLVCGDLPTGRLSSYMEELAGKRWRERFGLDKTSTAAPGRSGAVQRLPTYDSNWTVKIVTLDRDGVQVLQRP